MLRSVYFAAPSFSARLFVLKIYPQYMPKEKAGADSPQGLD